MSAKPAAPKNRGRPKAADFVVLGDDPLAHEADPDAVRDIAVLATYCDGVEVHSA